MVDDEIDLSEEVFFIMNIGGIDYVIECYMDVNVIKKLEEIIDCILGKINL